MAQADKYLDLCEGMRSASGVESRSAILEKQERVEIIRGKDFVRYITANQEKIDFVISKGKPSEEIANDLGALLLRRGLIVRCDRMYHKPPPGQDRLVKFPKKVVRVRGADALVFSPEGFYAWAYERPTSLWVYGLSALAAVGVVLVCLFPLAPYPIKIGVVYLSATLLTIMLSTIAIRAVVALLSWLATGSTVWLLPNVLADDKPFKEMFAPWIEVSKPTETGSKWNNHIITRLGVGVVAAGVCYVLYSNAPDKGEVVNNMHKYRDEFFDMINLAKPAITSDDITGETKQQQPVMEEPIDPSGSASGVEEFADDDDHVEL